MLRGSGDGEENGFTTAGGEGYSHASVTLADVREHRLDAFLLVRAEYERRWWLCWRRWGRCWGRLLPPIPGGGSCEKAA